MKLKILFLAGLLFVCSSHSTLAFEEGAASVIKLNNESWLYIVTADYGSPDQEIHVPIAAAPSWQPRTQGAYLKYQIKVNDEPVIGLATQAIVLSNAPVVDNQYVVQAGEVRTFTLFALMTLPATAEGNQTPVISVEVTNFPLGY